MVGRVKLKGLRIAFVAPLTLLFLSNNNINCRSLFECDFWVQTKSNSFLFSSLSLFTLLQFKFEFLRALRMAAGVYYNAVGALQSHSYFNNFTHQQKLENNLLRLVRSNYLSWRGCSVIRSSASQTSVVATVLTSSRSNTSDRDTHKKSNETALILIRHGESLWNEKNLFTGCVDVPLSKKGIDEAIEAGKRISSIPVDLIFTSALIRAQMTAMLAMTQHRRRKVPIVMHNESEQARDWSQIFSEDTKKQSIPVTAAWQLNERMYGKLQGLNKQETAEKFGKEQVHEWRRSYDIPPPNGESLEMCAQRAVAYFRDQIEPQLLSGKNVMIAAHGNSLRSIIMYLDKLTSQEVISLELSTGIPMLYIFKEGRFIRRGSPIGPTEAGVYAYTRSLALYRQRLDDMFQ
ncbi:hypothetical protein RJT34_12107 [Clitoria ternatea]|uniref:phosphoglycerate mutase (2,3-diphosphoglycerate-dependent) n=1 Tax=Clitoria ternatea TaxID=43366 RepID=A0AAN9JNA1_CLITE